MKNRMAILILICFVILGSWSLAEADHVYVSFGVALGGAAVGAAGVGFFFFFSGSHEIGEAPPLLRAGLLNLARKEISWQIPELEIKTTESYAAGPQGIEGYACLFKWRW